jgi:hypothetical protein
VDEATSLQAIERNAPDKPARPGSVTKQEFEYTRHGTTTLTAGLDVVTGQVVAPTLEATRTDPTTGSVVLSRPLCEYPSYPRYKGHGNVNVASSFTCTAP